MKKAIFEEPEFTVVLFDGSDLVTTDSANGSGSEAGGWLEDECEDE